FPAASAWPKRPVTASLSSCTIRLQRDRKLTFNLRKKYSPMNKNDPRKALGKGLHSLLPPRNPAAGTPAEKTPPPAPAATPAPAPEPGPAKLPIHQVSPNPSQPRRKFDETALGELKQSIARDGVLQPLLVRKTGDNVYQIIAGERRWRAARDA